MPTQLFFSVTAQDDTFISVHFCERQEYESIAPDLAENGIVAMPIVGSEITNYEALYRAFAVALRMPKGWYGEEEYAPNANAFLEYLDDVQEWVPSKGHVVVINNSEQLWREQPRLASFLVESWQFATLKRGAKIHLLFVW